MCTPSVCMDALVLCAEPVQAVMSEWLGIRAAHRFQTRAVMMCSDHSGWRVSRPSFIYSEHTEGPSGAATVSLSFTCLLFLTYFLSFYTLCCLDSFSRNYCALVCVPSVLSDSTKLFHRNIFNTMFIEIICAVLRSATETNALASLYL